MTHNCADTLLFINVNKTSAEVVKYSKYDTQTRIKYGLSDIAYLNLDMFCYIVINDFFSEYEKNVDDIQRLSYNENPE